MKKLLLLMFLIIPLANLNSQTIMDTIYKTRKIKIDGRKIIVTDTIVRMTNNYSDPPKILGETKPYFPGGMEALAKYIKYNAIMQKGGDGKIIRGKAMVKFTIDTLGFVQNPIVIYEDHPFLGTEAKRVVRKMPKWKPGTKNGTPLNVEMVLPITF